MIARETLWILMVVSCVAWAQNETTLKSSVELEVHDVDMIRKTLEELVTKPSLQFIEYGPDGIEGYKYHTSTGENKEYIIHTSGPIAVPIIETIRGTREEKDRKLLARLITSSKIKSMDIVKSEN